MFKEFSSEMEIKRELVNQLIQIRRYLHRYPELSFQEYKTCSYIIEVLENWGVPFQRIGDTGVIVDIVGEKGPGLHIGIRADIDALPLEEKTELSFASENPGIMHACGHDGHTAILLGVIYQLFQQKSELRGRIRCIFQPGEEAEGAAQQMIEQGVLENPKVDIMLALHLWPYLPFGSVGIKYGSVTASCDDFTVEIQGKGGHGARPQQSIDAIAISAQILQAISFLVTKGNNPVDPVVVHVGKISGGTASNIVADRVVLEGTIRSVSPITRNKVREQLNQLVTGIVKTYGAGANIVHTDGCSAIFNDHWLTNCVEEGVKELLGPGHLYVLNEPSMGADDFGAFAEKVPSTYFRLGIKKEGQVCYDLHHSQFQFDDLIIPLGVKIFTWIIFTKLQKGE